MALGGGTFTTQNKTLPGAYINTVSAARASSTLSDRGVAAMPFVGDWGPEGEVFAVTGEEFQKNSLKLFGYPYTAPEVQMFREIFRGARMLYAYRLNTGTVKAANEYATARYGGSRGNALTLVVEESVDLEDGLVVRTLLDGAEVDVQTVPADGKPADNDYLFFIKNGLKPTVGMNLVGGSDGTGRTGASYQAFLDKVERHSFNTLGCNTDEKEVIDLFVAFTKRMRDEVGVKFQTVVYRAQNADHEGIVSVENKLLDVDVSLFGEFSLVYWVTGALAGCPVNESCTNKVYDGEYNVDVDYTQRELESAITSGKFILHQVGDTVRVLDDINSFVSVTTDKNEDFQSNQTIRVLDQIGNDIAVLFNDRYLGKIPNDDAGRISFWSDVVHYNQQLETIRAITDFDAQDVVVEKGDDKKSVVVTTALEPTNSMTKLYMTVVVS